MPEHKLCVPCLFGLEGPLGNELRHMGRRYSSPASGINSVRSYSLILVSSS